MRTTQKQETPINIHTHTTHTDFKTEYYGRIQGYKLHTPPPHQTRTEKFEMNKNTCLYNAALRRNYV